MLFSFFFPHIILIQNAVHFVDKRNKYTVGLHSWLTNSKTLQVSADILTQEQSGHALLSRSIGRQLKGYK